MKHIDKTTKISEQGRTYLNNWVADLEQRSGKTITELAKTVATKKLWAKLKGNSKNTLRLFLDAEQNGMCCYCGSQLVGRTHLTVIEHFRLKAGNPARNMFDYDNLLLSCHGNKYDFYEVGQGDTWATIVAKSTFGNEVELKSLNPDVEKGGNGEPKIAESLIIGFTKGNVHHCDNFRNDKHVPISPTENPDCITRFEYVVKKTAATDIIGDVRPSESQDIQDVELTINNLNLKACVLIKNRAAVVSDAQKILKSIAADVVDNAIDERQQIVNIAAIYLSSVTRFYVVYRAYLIDDFPELFV